MIIINASHVFFMFLWLLAIENVQTKNYKLKLVSLQKCDLPESRMYKGVNLTYYLSARKVSRQTTVIRTNFTIGSKFGPGFITFRGYQVQQSSIKDLVFKLEKLSCHNPFTYQLVQALKLKLDKDCYAMPGTYSADSINLDDFSWLFSKAVVGPGKYSFDVEFACEKGVAACISITCDMLETK